MGVKLSAAIIFILCATALAQDADQNKKLLERFPQADTNKDGVLSDDELAAFKKSVRKNGGVLALDPNGGAKPTTRPTKDQKAARRVSRMRVQPTFTDISYGPFEMNRLDFWKAPSQS